VKVCSERSVVPASSARLRVTKSVGSSPRPELQAGRAASGVDESTLGDESGTLVSIGVASAIEASPASGVEEPPPQANRRPPQASRRQNEVSPKRRMSPA